MRVWLEEEGFIHLLLVASCQARTSLVRISPKIEIKDFLNRINNLYRKELFTNADQNFRQDRVPGISRNLLLEVI